MYSICTSPCVIQPCFKFCSIMKTPTPILLTILYRNCVSIWPEILWCICIDYKAAYNLPIWLLISPSHSTLPTSSPTSWICELLVLYCLYYLKLIIWTQHTLVGANAMGIGSVLVLIVPEKNYFSCFLHRKTPWKLVLGERWPTAIHNQFFY